jgi:site-specific DNA-adenine methylase
MTQLKTCLRYPGGKSRAVPKLAQYFPDLKNYDEFREPLVGGGSVALYITKQYPFLDIWVNDLYEPLVNFWQQLQMFGTDLKDNLKGIKLANDKPELARDLFLYCKDKLHEEGRSNLDRAVDFYIINKCSFSGLTESSSFSAQASENNFSLRGIEKLPEYSKLIEHWRITNYSYDYLMDGNKGVFMYLDPPYDIKDNLYGNRGSMHKGFDHDKFAADCDVNNVDMMVSYNSSQLIKERFKNWKAIEFSHTYTMRSVGDYMKDQHERKELVLINYEL